MPRYVELHAHSYYSLLDGVPSPEQLVEHAAGLDMPALALTDHDALYGLPRFVSAAEQAGIKPIIGIELSLINGGGHLTLLAENSAGYANLCRLVTLARRDQQKGIAALPWRLLADHAKGVIALSGCRHSEIARALLDRNPDPSAGSGQVQARRIAERFATIFGKDNFFLEMQRHRERGDQRLCAGLADLSQRLGLRLVATGNVHYLDPSQARLHDVLTCIRHRVPLDSAEAILRTNAEYAFRSPAEMAALFADWPDALQATLDIAERCSACWPEGPQIFPQLPTPDDQPAVAFLRQLCEDGLARKIPPSAYAHYRAQLDREIAIIAEQNLTDYFLVVWDVVRFAREQGILCQGRGSAANSLVSFLIDISPVDPFSAGLVFERFLSRERVSALDIDIDFDAARREEVIQYVYRRYGHDHAAMACTIVTFGARQAVRDVGMALGFSEETLDQISERVDTHNAADLPASPSLRSGFGAQLDSPRWRQLITLAAAIDGFPRHLGIHNGGMVISGPPLVEQIPIEPASMEDRTVVQWDKDALETMGWVKLDVLGLRTLSAIADACAIVERQTGRRLDPSTGFAGQALATLRYDDPKVFAMIRRGETVGVFQVESRAQASLIPRFKTRSFADIVIQIALIRPGPVQANMVHPYLRRRDGIEPIGYLHPLLKPALQETLGVILFQEQVLKVARDFAGFTAGEGELLRRALGHKRTDTHIEGFRDRFLAGAQAKGVSLKVAEQVFAQLKAFGGYSFSKAHAAAFAVITYWSAWLRCYHPLAFFAGLLRHQPMGFYPKHVVVSDAQRAGVKFLPVDLRYSQSEATVEGDAIRLGLGDVQGFGADQIELLEAERQRGPFKSLADLVERTNFDRRHIETLVLAGALDYLGERRQLLWDIAEAYRLARRPPRWAGRKQPEMPLHSPDERPRLKPMDKPARLSTAFAVTGVSLEGHLTSLRRDAFTRAGARSIKDLPTLKNGQRVKIGGVVVAHQHPPTAKGYAFLAVEDPEGIVNVVIAPDVYAQYRDAIHSLFVIVDGVLQRDHGAIHVVAREVSKV
jgi:error-prone DNA polymerase